MRLPRAPSCRLIVFLRVISVRMRVRRIRRGIVSRGGSPWDVGQPSIASGSPPTSLAFRKGGVRFGTRRRTAGSLCQKRRQAIRIVIDRCCLSPTVVPSPFVFFLRPCAGAFVLALTRGPRDRAMPIGLVDRTMPPDRVWMDVSGAIEPGAAPGHAIDNHRMGRPAKIRGTPASGLEPGAEPHAVAESGNLQHLDPRITLRQPRRRRVKNPLSSQRGVRLPSEQAGCRLAPPCLRRARGPTRSPPKPHCPRSVSTRGCFLRLRAMTVNETAVIVTFTRRKDWSAIVKRVRRRRSHGPTPLQSKGDGVPASCPFVPSA